MVALIRLTGLLCLLFPALNHLPTAAQEIVPQELPKVSEKTVQESSSKVRFPIEMIAPGTRDVHHLAGMGIRTKTIFKVKVYAYGLYVHGPEAGRVLAAWKDKPTDKLESDGSLYKKLLGDEFAKSLRLVMTRDVDGDDMSAAFRDALKPRVDHAKKKFDMPGGLEAMWKFRQYFDVDELKQGTVLVFTWLPGGKLITHVDGKLKGEIESKALSWALFDVYLGSDPISKKGKQAMVGRLPGILKAFAPAPKTKD